MKKRKTDSRTLRGEIAFSLPIYWRMDGAAKSQDAPLVVCMHGQWMTEDFFALLIQKLFDLPFRFLLPRGPYPIPVPGKKTIGASWYSYDGNQERFLDELVRTEQAVLDVLHSVESAHGLRPRRRYMLGFSQGGYAGSYIALHRSDLFSRLVISGARVKEEALEEEIRVAGERGFRALICHGTRDKAVPIEAAERSRKALARGGVTSEVRTFNAAHSIGRSQVIAIREWLMEQEGLGSTES